MQSQIVLAQKQDPMAQKQLYEWLAPKMLSTCRVYVKDLHFAEDCMIKGFVKVFKNCKNYQHKGSFEGWVRRIMINECLTYLRSQTSFVVVDEEKYTESQAQETEFSFDAQELLDRLPDGYRLVFSLFVMEEWSHKEIANKLDISESTSKSQLYKAKQKLRELVHQKESLQK